MQAVKLGNTWISTEYRMPKISLDVWGRVLFSQSTLPWVTLWSQKSSHSSLRFLVYKLYLSCKSLPKRTRNIIYTHDMLFNAIRSNNEPTLLTLFPALPSARTLWNVFTNGFVYETNLTVTLFFLIMSGGMLKVDALKLDTLFFFLFFSFFSLSLCTHFSYHT